MVKRFSFVVLIFVVALAIARVVHSGAIHAGGNGNNGSVTSIDVSGGTTGLTFSGGPLTTSGTITAAGTVAVANGGTNLTAATDDRIMIGNGTTWQSKALADCHGSAGNAIDYTASSNTVSCDAITPVALGAVTAVNAISTVSGGVPAEYATVDLTGQTAAIAATTIYAVPASGVGMYRVSYVAKVTTVATTSSTLGGFQVKYTDATDSVVVTTVAGTTSTLNTTQAQVSGSVIVYAKASTNIQYIMGYVSSSAAEMTYNLHIKVEAM